VRTGAGDALAEWAKPGRARLASR